MPRTTMDRRVARTRARLEEAHISLILEKGYEDASVEDICEAANVARSTFYSHYASKDDLKRSGLEHLRRQLVGRQRDALAGREDVTDLRFGFSLPMFEHARDHMDLYRAMSGTRGGAVALEAIRQILSDLVREELAAISHTDSDGVVQHELAVQYFVGAYMAVLTSWLDGGAKLPPQQVDFMFRRLAVGGVGPSESSGAATPFRTNS